MNAEAVASSAVYVAHLLERAVHDVGPWEMTWGEFAAPVERTVTDSGVIFTAVFPDSLWTKERPSSIVLRCRGEVCAIRPIDAPGDASFVVTWELMAKRTSRVA